jgi:hypothetical protein
MYAESEHHDSNVAINPELFLAPFTCVEVVNAVSVGLHIALRSA